MSSNTYNFWQRHFVTLEADAKRQLIPQIAECHVSVIVCPPSTPDVKVAVEVGLSVLLDKPILVLRMPDRRVTPRLRRVADDVIDVPADARTWPPIVDAAVERLLGDAGHAGHQGEDDDP